MMETCLTAAEAAAGYLVSTVDERGWNDFRLPVGPATDWTTAFVAGALQDAAERLSLWDETDRALSIADEVLGAPRSGGWGYNSSVECDADSTAHAVLFLASRRPLPPSTEDFLRRHRFDDGFATFDSDDAWGGVHPCVTPLAAMATVALDPTCDRASLADMVVARRRADGTWPSYWWRGSHYATFWNLFALDQLGYPVAPYRPVVGGRSTEEIRSVLDLACVVGITSLGMGRPATGDLIRLLLDHQSPTGAFPGGADLRVTHHTCRTPWEAPVGELYTDLRGLITTALALRVLLLAGGS